MKNLYLLVLPIIFFVNVSPAQSFSWVNTGGNASYIDYGLGVAVDNNHNVIATGMHVDVGTFGTTTVNTYGLEDVFIAKYDSTGNLLWIHGIGGADQDWGYAVAVDASNNIYVTGTYAMYAIHFTATDSLAISSSSATNSFLAKYDANGNFLWARSGACSYSKSASVATDASGNAIVSGFFNGTIDFSSTVLNGGSSNLFFVKYSPTGNVIWAKAGVSSSICTTNAMKCDAAGNIYATGKISNGITFGSSTYPNVGGDDMYTAKMDANGIVQWLKVEGNSVLASTTGNNFDCGNGIDVDYAGNVYVAGSLLDSVVGFSYHQGLVVLKYNSSGTRQWLQQYGDNGVDVCNSLSLDAAGEPYVIGSYQGALTIGTSALPAASDVNIFMAKFSMSGNCYTAIGLGNANGNDAGNGIAIDKNDGAICMTGTVRNTVNFGTINVNADNAGTIFVGRMYPGALNGINEIDAENGFAVYPNPSNGIINLQFKLAGDYSVSLYNATGQLVFWELMKDESHQIDLSAMPSGCYFISITDKEGNRTTGKIVKE